MCPVEPIQVRAPDLEIRVATPWVTGGQRMDFVLHSPSGAVEFTHRVVHGPPLHRPEAFRDKLFDQLNRIDGEYILNREEIRDELESLGDELYRLLFPPELKMLYPQIRQHVTSLLVISDEAWIPWEIVRPPNDDHLCMGFEFSRWLTGDTSQVQGLRVRNVLGLVTDPTQELLGAEEEVESLAGWVRDLAGIDGVFRAARRFQDISRYLQSDDFDLIHMTGHGKHDRDSGESSLQLEDRPFFPRHLSGQMLERLRSNHPFVFFNHCQLGQLSQSITQLEGWPARWVRSGGCSGFIGPLWPIDDDQAHTFSSTFYRQLAGGACLAQAVLATRRALRDASFSPMIWLSYSLYGHPNAKIVFGDAALRDGPPASPPVSPTAHRQTPTAPISADGGPRRRGLETSPAGPSARPSQTQSRPPEPHLMPSQPQRPDDSSRSSTPRKPPWKTLIGVAVLVVLTAVILVRLEPFSHPEVPGTTSGLPSTDTGPSAGSDPKTLQPDTAPADTTQTDTAPVDTAPADTTQTDTAPADTAQTDTAQTEPAVRSASPPVDTAPPPPPPVATKSAPRWTYPVAPVTPNKLVILVRDVSTQTVDREVAQAIETMLIQERLDFSPSVPGIKDSVAAKFFDGDVSFPGDGQTPWGAQLLLIVSSGRTSLPQSAAHLTGFSLSLQAELIDAQSGVTIQRTASNHTGLGPSANEALTQASKRCLREILTYLKEET